MSGAVLLLVISNQSFPRNCWEISLLYGEQGGARRALRRCWPWKSSAKGKRSTLSEANKQQIKNKHNLMLALLSLWKLIGRIIHIPFLLRFLPCVYLNRAQTSSIPGIRRSHYKCPLFSVLLPSDSSVADHFLLPQSKGSSRNIWKPVVCRRGSRLLTFKPDFRSRYQFKASVLATV